MDIASAQPPSADGLVSTGVPGSDDVSAGGFASKRLYLVESPQRTGKTTVALRLLEGAQGGESVLYGTPSETREELEGVARLHGWEPDGLQMRELLLGRDDLRPDTQHTLFHPAALELSEMTLRILADVEKLAPRTQYQPAGAGAG